jgi:DNA/RNA endonuclease YhcR with UshA esterase domain
MRALLMAALLAVITGQDAKTIAPEDAAKHVGETVRVQGTVSHVKIAQHDGAIYVDFGPMHPNQVFTAFIPPVNAKSFPNIEKLTGKTVIVEGKITLYKGKPQIKVTDAVHLQIVT